MEPGDFSLRLILVDLTKNNWEEEDPIKKRWIAIFTIVMIIVVVAGFAIAFAKQEKQGKTEKGQWEKGKGYAAKGMQRAPGMMFSQKLNLTDEQKKQIKEQKLAFMKETLPIRNELGVKKIELQELWSTEQPDAKKIIAKQKEISELTSKLSEKAAYHRIEMGKIFTPEQKKMMREGMGKMMAQRRMGQQSGRGMGMMGGKGCCGGMGGMGMEQGKGMNMQNCPMNQ